MVQFPAGEPIFIIMINEKLKEFIAEKDKGYKEYLENRAVKVKELEKIIHSIWWRINKVEWNFDNNEVIITAEDQGGWPFEALRFKSATEDWLDLLEEILIIKKRKYK